MAERCPVHGPAGQRGDCKLCLSVGKNIILCNEHGFQHVEANNCILCASKGRVRGRIVKSATAPNPHNGRWPRDVAPR
jgi:hypothetical protein